jgi:hypothetical protein
MDARQWLAAYAERLGVAAPTDAELETLLALAGVAAHASERIAAPRPSTGACGGPGGRR